LREIKDYPGYFVKEDGTVWTDKNGTLRQLRPGVRGKGYLHVILSKGTKASRKGFSVHRLVAEAYIPNPDNLPQVNHIDEVKTNNAVGNLEWATGSQNVKHSHVPKFGNNAAARRKLFWPQVCEIRQRLAAGERQCDLAKEFDVRQCTISAIKLGRLWPRET
jgi:HNH endonuclease